MPIAREDVRPGACFDIGSGTTLRVERLDGGRAFFRERGGEGGGWTVERVQTIEWVLIAAIRPVDCGDA